VATPTAAGLIDVLDGYIHAARPGVLRPMSVCGAGPLVVELTGSYDATDPLACPRCSERLSPPVEVAEPDDAAQRTA
jgi:hypothetical protein